MVGSRRKPVNESRRDAAIAAKLKGMPWRGVADKWYGGNLGNCWQDIKEEVEALRRKLRDAAVDYIEEMIERHQAAIVQLTEIAEAEHPLVDHGHVVRSGVPMAQRKEIEELIERNGGDVTPELLSMLMGEPLLDDAVNVMAQKEMRQRDAELAKLLGLNKPVKVDTTTKTHVTYEVVGIDPSALD